MWDITGEPKPLPVDSGRRNCPISRSQLRHDARKRVGNAVLKHEVNANFEIIVH